MKNLVLTICLVAVLLMTGTVNADVMKWDDWNVVSETPWTSTPDTYIGESPGAPLAWFPGGGINPEVLPTFTPNPAYENTTILKLNDPQIIFRLPASRGGTHVKMDIYYFERYASPIIGENWKETSFHWHQGWVKATYEWDVPIEYVYDTDRDQNIPLNDVSIDVILKFDGYFGGPDDIYAPYIDSITFETTPFPPTPVDIQIDEIKNGLNVRSNRFLTVNVLGSDELDVRDIDPASIKLDGVSPKRLSFKEWNSFEDLVLGFRVRDISEAIGEVQAGDIVLLNLKGVLYSGREFQGTGYVTIRKPGKKK